MKHVIKRMGLSWTFGHIELNVSIIHPLFINHVVNILKIFCWKCNEFLLTKDHLELNNILKLEKEKKFNAVLEKIKNVIVVFIVQHQEPIIN